MQIYLIRHGETRGSQGEKRYIGRTSYSLTSRGRWQMERRAESLRGICERRQGKILSSTSSRCMESAEIMAGILGYEVLSFEGLMEIHMGSWENRTFREIRSQYPQEYEKRGRMLADYVVSGGESFQMVQERAVRVLRSQIELWNQSQEVLLVVTHSGVIRSLLSLCNQTPLKELMQYKISTSESVKLDQEQIRRLIC